MQISSCERRLEKPKHVSLTHWMRRKWNPYAIQQITTNCNISPNVGELPPELRTLVPREKLAECTAQFHDVLHDFIVNNYYTVINSPIYRLVPLRGAIDLFGTHCTIEYGGKDETTGRLKWHGSLGMVCRISFPRIGAGYALKIFYAMPNRHGGHGPLFEIPTAFAAMHGEPRDNAPVYMASFLGDGYMLSKWMWQKNDGVFYCRDNKNELFTTSERENQARNFAQGRRIDYGQTYRTMYGGASYRVRKLARIIWPLAAARDVRAIRDLFAQNKNMILRRELNRAMEIVCISAYMQSETKIQQFLARDWQK